MVGGARPFYVKLCHCRWAYDDHVHCP